MNTPFNLKHKQLPVPRTYWWFTQWDSWYNYGAWTTYPIDLFSPAEAVRKGVHDSFAYTMLDGPSHVAGDYSSVSMWKRMGFEVSCRRRKDVFWVKKRRICLLLKTCMLHWSRKGKGLETGTWEGLERRRRGEACLDQEESERDEISHQTAKTILLNHILSCKTFFTDYTHLWY